jgi:hypothetical protein
MFGALEVGVIQCFVGLIIRKYLNAVVFTHRLHHGGQELECLAATLWSNAALVRQELEAG